MYCEFFHVNFSNISSKVYVFLKNKQTKTLDFSGHLGKALQLLYLILILSVKYFLIHLVCILPAFRHRDSEWQGIKKRGKEGQASDFKQITKRRQEVKESHISLGEALRHFPHSPAFSNSCLQSSKNYC